MKINKKCETTHQKRSEDFGKYNMEGTEKIWNP